VAEAAQAAGVTLGTILRAPEQAAVWRARGARYFVVTLEAVLGPASHRFLHDAHD
jgi:hypothetical protein